MASRRIASRLVLQSAAGPFSRPSLNQSARAASTLGRAAGRRQPARITRPLYSPVVQQSRKQSIPSDAAKAKPYNFDEVKAMVDAAYSGDKVLIDVREPSEFEAGSIPTALNVPITSQPDALLLPPDEFFDRFGFSKPSPDKEVVFYCKAGVRSGAAVQLALQNGYRHVGEYKGSWLDWQKNGGPSTKDPGS